MIQHPSVRRRCRAAAEAPPCNPLHHNLRLVTVYRSVGELEPPRRIGRKLDQILHPVAGGRLADRLQFRQLILTRRDEQLPASSVTCRSLILLWKTAALNVMPRREYFTPAS